MSDWTLIEGTSRYQASTAVNLTGDGSANTKPASYTELISSINGDCTGLFINIVDANTTYSFLLDIAIGAVNSEVIIIPDIACYFAANSSRNLGMSCFFPIHIPSGTRISGRVASSTASKVLAIQCLAAISHGYSQKLSGVYTMGATIADTGGTSIDPGGSAGVKGGWVTLSASTPFHFRMLGIAFVNPLNTARSSCYWYVDVGIGASPQVIIPDLYLASSATTDNLAPTIISPILLNIPKGSQLSVRASCDITDATDRLFDVVLYGVY